MLTDTHQVPGVDAKFELGPEISDVQREFLDRHGFIHFRGVAAPDEVRRIRVEVERVESELLASKRTHVNGVPLFFGWPGGRKAIQRIPYTSRFSETIEAFVRDQRFEPIRRLVDKDARIGTREKDGVVLNSYVNLPGSIYRRLGWHTDGLRDIFYGRMPDQMLNVGLHLDDCDRENGGLRLIPGTHTQGFWSTCFHKAYFVSHGSDPCEVCVETRAGDLTIHDGRLWHRVAQSRWSGDRSVRRAMYVPYVTGPVEEKDESSPTPGYHRLGMWARRIRNRRFAS